VTLKRIVTRSVRSRVAHSSIKGLGSYNVSLALPNIVPFTHFEFGWEWYSRDRPKSAPRVLVMVDPEHVLAWPDACACGLMPHSRQFPDLYVCHNCVIDGW